MPEFPFVNIARWRTAGDFMAATQSPRFRESAAGMAGYRPHPALVPGRPQPWRGAAQIPVYPLVASTSVALCSLSTPSTMMTSLSELSVRSATISW